MGNKLWKVYFSHFKEKSEAKTSCTDLGKTNPINTMNTLITYFIHTL